MSFNIYLKDQKAVPDTSKLLMCNALKNMIQNDNQNLKGYYDKYYSEVFGMRSIVKLKKMAENELIGNNCREL